ncbi:unnamed protein product [Dibothriocephalus latus]|uniref:FERM domain-containing protein n=1 Tax=Dibothriocephalus latus TaxID=60516 RepID=A0A3P7MDT2_DIBLA|nr:unnamed protein product [Dibothriocephalus latus]
MTPQFLRLVALFHRQLRGLVASRADLLFLRTAQKLASYGIELHRAAPDSCPCLRKLQPPSSALQPDVAVDRVRSSSDRASGAGTAFSRSAFDRRSLQQRPAQTASLPAAAFQRSLSLAFRTSNNPRSLQVCGALMILSVAVVDLSLWNRANSLG